MEIYAKLHTKVSIDPIDVLSKLIDDTIDENNWIFMKNNGHFVGYDQSCGQHSTERCFEISKEKYDFVNALIVAKSYLKLNKKI
jgi:hypothetical protein